MSLTLEKIEAQRVESEKALTELAKMIAAFKLNQPTTFVLPQVAIELQPGERYAGLMLDDEGKPSHHLILLPGEADGTDWNESMAWATKAGGELPTRREQSLLFANLRSEFKAAWYWSCEQSSASGAWGQYFDIGFQYDDYESAAGRARAVRRFPA